MDCGTLSWRPLSCRTAPLLIFVAARAYSLFARAASPVMIAVVMSKAVLVESACNRSLMRLTAMLHGVETTPTHHP